MDTHDGMEQMRDRGIARRRLVQVGAGAAAFSLLPFMRSTASATTPSTDGEAATTTTLPPSRPVGDDIALLGFATSVELAIRDLYSRAVSTVDWPAVELTVMSTLREAHKAYAQSLSGFLGRDAPTSRDEEVFESLSESFSGDPAAVLQAAYDLESVAVATHNELLGLLQGTDGAALIASIAIVEARHGTALAVLAGNTDLADTLVDNEGRALTPAEG